ncbi:Asp/Glu racemase [Paroceanicella profunda]|uniref:Asp/Glu racemase n=1 Tax=Paroceanicella profunda TaxID=2579971 RepID=A0A5B8FVV8_9RHOB|nr:aspartate/glutamate racemase family protein [Paroceanicella profunda]QDL92575.1 Asp/Glu racemase [Paroceanicella profunda]
MPALPYRLDAPIGHRACLGLVVLQSDETIEPEFRRLIPAEGTALYASRIPSAAEVSAETLAQMEAHLPAAAALLPPSIAFDVVGYGCTSGATVIGPARVAELVRGASTARQVTNPISAVMTACDALGVRRLGFVTPYVAEVSAAMRGALEDHGLAIGGFGSFEEAEEAKVARIHPASILEAAIATGRQAPCDAVFLSCTNLRTIDIIAAAEAALGVPVISSNQALAWHMARLAGLDTSAAAGFGQLMRAGLPPSA